MQTSVCKHLIFLATLNIMISLQTVNINKTPALGKVDQGNHWQPLSLVKPSKGISLSNLNLSNQSLNLAMDKIFPLCLPRWLCQLSQAVSTKTILERFKETTRGWWLLQITHLLYFPTECQILHWIHSTKQCLGMFSPCLFVSERCFQLFNFFI